MNGTNSRRGFLKGFGLFSAAATGAATSHLANSSTGLAVWDPADPILRPVVDNQHLAPPGKVNITLINEKQNNVKMSVGLDDRLWIEVDGKWRRVALEG